MSTDQTTPGADGPNWGDPPPPAEEKKRWSGKRTAAAAGVAVAIAAAGGIGIYTGTAANGSEQQGGPGGRPGYGMGPRGGPGGLGGPAGLGPAMDALHGDFVVANPDGGYLTERIQTGEVTAISATSISLTSKDGYQQAYTINTETKKIKEPASGQTVTVLAKVDGNTATATTISEAGARRGGKHPGADGGPKANNQPGNQPGEPGEQQAPALPDGQQAPTPPSGEPGAPPANPSGAPAPPTA